jgi:hypothetical protein
MRRLIRNLAASAVLVATLAACGDDFSTKATAGTLPEALTQELAAFASPGKDYVGKVDGSDAYVALSVHGQYLIAYLCDGKALIKWFAGTVSGASLTGSAADKSALTATLDGTAVKGTFTVGTSTLSFTASAASGQAGFVEDIEGSATDLRSFVRRGWIVLADDRSGVARPGSSWRPTRAPVAAPRAADRARRSQRPRRPRLA